MVAHLEVLLEVSSTGRVFPLHCLLNAAQVGLLGFLSILCLDIIVENKQIENLNCMTEPLDTPTMNDVLYDLTCSIGSLCGA